VICVNALSQRATLYLYKSCLEVRQPTKHPIGVYEVRVTGHLSCITGEWCRVGSGQGTIRLDKLSRLLPNADVGDQDAVVRGLGVPLRTLEAKTILPSSYSNEIP
jgi:hypothetical protein